MEKRLQMDMQRKLRERQERLNREQAELQQKLQKQREQLDEAEAKSKRENIPSSYVVASDKKEVTVPNKVSTPTVISARATPMMNGITGVKTPSISREDLTLPLARPFTPKAPTPSVPKQAKTTASKLPPRPWDYDDYYYQDEDGNWRNEYDDEGYEFDPDVYEGDEDYEYYKENEYRPTGGFGGTPTILAYRTKDWKYVTDRKSVV